MKHQKKILKSTDINMIKYFMKKMYPPMILCFIQLVLWVYILYTILCTSSNPSNLMQAFIYLVRILYLLLLPVPELIYVIVAVIRKRRKRSQPQPILPKTENRNLMGFYHTAFTISPTIFFTLPGICYFFLSRKYLMTALLFSWLFLQLIEGKMIARNKELEKKKQLLKDVLSIYQEEKDLTFKSLHYAVIMEDDSRLIPSAFGNGNSSVTKVLLFDHATEIEPFLAEDPEKNFNENWRSLYLHSNFFIYAFDSNKYTAEELEQKCVTAITYSRFPVSKPLYLFILGVSPALDELVKKYAWLPEVSIQVIDSWSRIQAQDIVDDYTDKRDIPWYKSMEEEQAYSEKLGPLADTIYNSAMLEYMPYMKMPFFSFYVFGNDALKYNYWSHLTRRSTYLTRLLEQVECKDWDYFYHYLNPQTIQIFSYIQNGQLTFFHRAANFYVCGFFPNIFRWKEMSIAVMAEFEYAHLAMRFVHYYLFSKHTPGSIEEYFKEDKELGAAIFELAQPDDMLYAPLHQEMDLSDPLLHNALLILKELFGIEHKEETLDFLHLTNILRVSRNITRGHGAIRSGMQDQIWFALYVLLNLLNEMLSIGDMEIQLDGDYVKVSYRADDRWYLDGQYAIAHEHVPLLLHRISKKNRLEYINYYKGNAAVPEIMEFPKDNIK